MYAFYFTKFDTFGHDKYISYVEKIDHFVVITQKHFIPGGDPSQYGVGLAGKEKTLPLPPNPSDVPPEPPI